MDLALAPRRRVVLEVVIVHLALSLRLVVLTDDDTRLGNAHAAAKMPVEDGALVAAALAEDGAARFAVARPDKDVEGVGAFTALFADGHPVGVSALDGLEVGDAHLFPLVL